MPPPLQVELSGEAPGGAYQKVLPPGLLWTFCPADLLRRLPNIQYVDCHLAIFGRSTPLFEK